MGLASCNSVFACVWEEPQVWVWLFEGIPLFLGLEKEQTTSEQNDLFASELSKQLLFRRNPVAIKTPKFVQGIPVNDMQFTVLLLWSWYPSVTELQLYLANIIASIIFINGKKGVLQKKNELMW